MPTTTLAKVFTVSEFVEAIRTLLREDIGVVTIQGEVSDFRTRRDQLVFFALKDKESRILCFAMRYELRTVLEDGMELRVTGTPSLFKQRGEFHLRVIEVELVGEGVLKRAFELIKKRLEAEGLFRPERKRPLPPFPRTIGLITSPDAAAYTDVLRILKNRWPMVRVKFARAAVQGAGAARQMVQALDHFSMHQDVDVVILARGGGSLEDLQAFNDEAVARAIYACRIPVVVGVGHERDVTIADFVADKRAATPSNAAEIVVPDRAEVLHRLDVLSGRLARSLSSSFASEEARLKHLVLRLSACLERQSSDLRIVLQRFLGSVQYMLHRAGTLSVRLSHVIQQMSERIEQRVLRASDRLKRLNALLQSLSPLAILERGYSITMNEQRKIIKKSSELSQGQTMHTRFGAGEASSQVTEVR